MGNAPAGRVKIIPLKPKFIMKKSISRKIILSLLLVAVIPSVFISMVSYFQAKRSISAIVEDSLSLLSTEIGIEVEETVFTVSAHIKSLAENPVIKSKQISVDNKLFEMQKIQDFYKIFEDITLINADDGVPVTSTTYNYRGEWRTKPWFEEAMTGRVAVSPPHTLARPFKMVIVVTAPVFDESGKVDSVLAGQVNMTEIWKITDRLKLGKTGFVFLLDRSGNIIAFPDREKLFQKLEPVEFRENIMSGLDGMVRYVSSEGRKRLCFYQTLAGYKSYEGQGWRIGITQETSEAYAFIDNMLKNVVIVLAGGIIFIFFIAGLLSRNITNPIKELTLITKNYAKGDLDARVKIKTRDEIGELGDAFNRMGKSLTEITASRDDLGREVAARTLAEHKMIKAKEEAESANQVKSQFLANVSHEIRTPLNSIIGFSETMISGSDNQEEMRAQAKIILTEGEILLQLINDLLDDAKIEAGKIELDLMPFDLDNIIESVSSYAELVAQKKQLEWRVLMGDDVPKRLRGDELRLRQIILNLVNNAFKFTEKGSVELSVDLLENDSQQIGLRFSIKDTGIGIPKEKHKFIFESFTQADSSITRKYGGTGLGTNIAKNFVELMGGELNFDSIYGKGSVFWFTAFFSVLSAQEDKMLQMSAADGDMPTSHDGVRITGLILVVDDYEPNQKIALKYLENNSHVVEVASNGKDALAFCEEKTFDLILMDMQMPEMDGCEATRRIRSGNSGNTGTPILGLTANASANARNTCIDSGMNAVLTKPLRRDPFLKAVAHWLRMPKGKQDVNSIPEVLNDTGSQDTVWLPPLDYEQAVREFGCDRKFIDDLAGKFCKELGSQIVFIKKAFADKDVEAVRKEAHKIYGGAASIVAMPLAAAAGRLKELGKLRRIDDECAEAVEKLEEEYERLKEYAQGGGK